MIRPVRRWRIGEALARPAEGPLVIAHRGASAHVLENTAGAFARARTDGADGIELDVVRCASGEVIVFHDDDLTRLGQPGDARAIRALRLNEVRALRLDGREGRALAAATGSGDDDRVPTLEEALEAAGPELLVNVELKSPERKGARQAAALLDDGLARATAAVLRRVGHAERFVVSSFDPLQLARFRRLAPEYASAFLFYRGQSAPLERAWPARLLDAAAVHPEAALCDARAVGEWHAAGRAVNVWTVDDAREIAWLAALGVDGIITNRPAATRAVLDGSAAALRPVVRALAAASG